MGLRAHYLKLITPEKKESDLPVLLYKSTGQWTNWGLMLILGFISVSKEIRVYIWPGPSHMPTPITREAGKQAQLPEEGGKVASQKQTNKCCQLLVFGGHLLKCYGEFYGNLEVGTVARASAGTWATVGTRGSSLSGQQVPLP